MRYFVPMLTFPKGEQRTAIEKFGGLPWGLPAEDWPLCSECNRPLTHLFSLKHHYERLDLGREGRFVLVFQCNHDPDVCPTWDETSGANKVVFLDPYGYREALTPLPEPQPNEMGTEVEHWIRAWEVCEDGLDPAKYSTYFGNHRLPNYRGDREVVKDGRGWGEMFWETRLGNAPGWIEEDTTCWPGVPFYFAGQFSMFPVISEPIPQDRDPALFWEDGAGYTFAAAHYGHGGTAYLFIAPDFMNPQGLFFWQCFDEPEEEAE